MTNVEKTLSFTNVYKLHNIERFFGTVTPQINPFFSPVSESKVLCHPASVDSLSTSAGTEDHVSMGGFAARKALKVVENVERGK